MATFTSALERAAGTIVEPISHHFPCTELTWVLFLAKEHAVLHTGPEAESGERRNIFVFSATEEF